MSPWPRGKGLGLPVSPAKGCGSQGCVCLRGFMVLGSRSASLDQNLCRQVASCPPCPAPGSLACTTSVALAAVWQWWGVVDTRFCRLGGALPCRVEVYLLCQDKAWSPWSLAARFLSYLRLLKAAAMVELLSHLQVRALRLW